MIDQAFHALLINVVLLLPNLGPNGTTCEGQDNGVEGVRKFGSFLLRLGTPCCVQGFDVDCVMFVGRARFHVAEQTRNLQIRSTTVDHMYRPL